MSSRWQWWLFGIAALAAVAASLPLLLFWSQLPEPIAVHWSIAGTPDGNMAKPTALLFNLGLIGAALLVSLVDAKGAYAKGRAIRLLLVTFTCGVVAAASATIVERNFGVDTWTAAATLSPGALALMLGVPGAAAALAYAISLRAWRTVQRAAPPTTEVLPLPTGARAFWSGTASNGWLLALGALILLGPVTLIQLRRGTLAVPPWTLVLLVAFVGIELFSRVRVTIDGRGLTIRYGRLGLWTRHLPLDRVAAVQAVVLDALEYGGWGYRGGLRLFKKAAIVVRSGPALRLDLHGGQQLFVTVDDAATGAQLLRALIERQASPA